jgi:hypothetical protein
MPVVSFRRALLALVVLAVTGVVWVAALVSFLLAGVALLPLGIAVGVTVAVLFAAFWLSGAAASIGARGDAEVVNGRYVLNNHGTITVVDETTYARQRALPDRMALSVLGGFGVAGAALCLVAAARRRAGA